MAKSHLSLGILLCENMAETHLLDHDLSTACHLVALCSGLSCFHLRHFFTFLGAAGNKTPLRAALFKTPYGTFSHFLLQRRDCHAHHLSFKKCSFIQIILYSVVCQSFQNPVEDCFPKLRMSKLSSAKTY